MQVKELKQDGLQHEMEITVTAKDIDSRIDSRLAEVGKTMKMPGFRPGKVPLAMLKQRYGRAIMGEVLELAVNETSNKVLKDKNLRPAMQPKIEVKTFDEGTDLTYTMSVEVLPKIEIADFKNLKLEKPVAKPAEAEINEALTRIAASQRTTKPIEKPRASQNGDTVVIDFKGRTADDNFEHPGMAAEAHDLELGSNMFIPGFEAQLVGKNAGDKVEVSVDFPKDYGAKDLAGRKAIFDVTIHEIREAAEAEINEEFAKTLGLESLEALKNAVSEQLGKEYARQSRMVLKKALMDYLDEAHQFKAPQSMLDLEFQNIMDQLKLERQRNGEEGELSQAEQDEFREIADRRVRLGLVLSEIGLSNKIQIGDAELQRAVITEAQKFPGQERQVFDFYAKNRNALESLRAPLFEDKVVDYILELATITEKEIGVKELMTALDDEDGEDEAPKKKAKTEGKKKK